MTIDPSERDPHEEALSAARERLPLGAIVRAGGRDPVVVILVLAGFFDGISGNPIHGLVLGAAAAAIAFDEAAGLADGPTWPGLSSFSPVVVGHEKRPMSPALQAISQPLTWPARVLLTTGALAYAIVVGAFARYSWPATLTIVSTGSIAVVIAWRGPLHRAELGDDLSATPWAVVFIALGLWELVALLLQPSLTTDSWAHPTLSTLMDPVLASHPGRSISILVWFALGAFLMRR